MLITIYKLVTLGNLGYKNPPIYLKLLNELLSYTLLAAYVVLKSNKDILISFSKLDEVTLLETTYHKSDRDGEERRVSEISRSSIYVC